MSRETTSAHEEVEQASRHGERRITTATTLIAAGFAVGRERGRTCGMQDIAYGAAFSSGFAVGVAEAVLQTLAAPWAWLVGGVVAESAE